MKNTIMKEKKKLKKRSVREISEGDQRPGWY